jgi:hypothetical protein
MTADWSRRRVLLASAAGLAAGLLPGLGRAAPADVPTHIAQAIRGARLLGAGRFRYLLFHVYDARFYVGDRGFKADQPDAEPYALDLEYARHFAGAAIAKTTLDEFERFDAGTPALRAKWYDILLKLLPDVDEGQHLTGLFLPKVGLRLYSNGKPVGAVDDPEFAHWFFAIWLDPRTQGPELRSALLGQGGSAALD